jgi:hypothetical protein
MTILGEISNICKGFPTFVGIFSGSGKSGEKCTVK